MNATMPAVKSEPRGALARLARWCSHHRWLVIGVWLVVMFVAQGAAAAAGPDYRTDFVLPESESNEVFELLEDADPNSAGFSAQIVARAANGVEDPAVRSNLESLFGYVESKGDISVASPYDVPSQISEDGTIAFAQIDISDSRQFSELPRFVAPTTSSPTGSAPVPTAR